MYISANPEKYDYISVKVDQSCNGGVCYGHALSETYGASDGYFGWYGNSSYFPYRTSPWVMRGGGYDNYGATGIFRAGRSSGHTSGYNSSRAVFTP